MVDKICAQIKDKLIRDYGIVTFVDYKQGTGYRILFNSSSDIDEPLENYLCIVPEKFLGPSRVKDAVEYFTNKHPEFLL